MRWKVPQPTTAKVRRCSNCQALTAARNRTVSACRARARSLARPTQPNQRVVNQPVDLEPVLQRPFARAEGALRGNPDVVDAGLSRRRLDARDQLAHALLCDI